MKAGGSIRTLVFLLMLSLPRLMVTLMDAAVLVDTGGTCRGEKQRLQPVLAAAGLPVSFPPVSSPPCTDLGQAAPPRLLPRVFTRQRGGGYIRASGAARPPVLGRWGRGRGGLFGGRQVPTASHRKAFVWGSGRGGLPPSPS